MPNMILEFPLNGIQLDLGTTATFDDISGYLNTERLEGDLPLSQTSGKLPIERVSGDIPASRITGDIPISQTSGNLPASRISGNLPLSQTSGNLPVNRLEDISGVMSAQDAHNIWTNI